MARKIKVKGSKRKAIVDDEDYEVSKYEWFMFDCGNGPEPCRITDGGEIITMALTVLYKARGEMN